MKNKVALGLLFFSILFLFVLNISAAQNITSCDAGDKTCKISNGYACLQKNIDAKKCSSLGSDEKVFSFITSGSCSSEVESDSKYRSSNQGSLRYTSLALLGGADSNNPEEWLASKNKTTDNLDWFLQIESPDAAECTVTHGNSVQSTVSINVDKTLLGSGLDSCLSISSSSGNYWLQISKNCFNAEFKISCDKSFLTSLLYQKTGSSTVYVSDETHSASASGETKEQVRSLCFSTGSACDYEGSLWAALVLSSLNHDVSSFIPYLVTNADTGNNKNFLPNAFLYLFTGDFQTDLLSQQKADKWWEASTTNDRFYDTSLALYSLKYDEPIQKQNAENWLLDEAQGSDGCWNSGNVRDTAFVLYALEPRSVGGLAGSSDGENASDDCESSGYYCMSGISCSQAGGNIKNSYSCSGAFVCCDRQKEIQTCSEQNGIVCSSGKSCSGTEVQASDISSGEICCVQGACATPSETPEARCESSGGTCRIDGCLSGEKESSESCQFNTDVCCVQESAVSGINLGGVSSLWIWILLVLILLLVLGIVFREKLRMLWFRIRSGGGTSSHQHSGPSGRPPFAPSVPRIMPRPISRAIQKRPGEIDEVLKKLKEMGK